MAGPRIPGSYPRRQNEAVADPGFITFLRVRDLPAAGRFCEGTLGLRLVLDQGACRIYRAGPSVYLGLCQGEPPEPASSVCLTWVVDDVDGWHGRLSAAGAVCDGPPRVNEAYGIYHFFAEGPEGYRVEVQRFLDPAWAG